MERYVIDNNKEQAYRKFFQTGGGMDGYIYTQEGEGIGSLFGNLFQKVLPFVTKAIKGAAGIAGPHLKHAATEITSEAGKSLIRKLNNNNHTRSNNKKKLSFNQRKRRRLN